MSLNENFTKLVENSCGFTPSGVVVTVGPTENMCVMSFRTSVPLPPARQEEIRGKIQAHYNKGRFVIDHEHSTSTQTSLVYRSDL